MNAEYPAAQVAAVHSAVLGPLHVVHVSTEGSAPKSLQQNPPGIKVEYPDAHVAATHSVVPEPLHAVHTSTDASVAKPLQQNPASMNVA